MMTTAQPRTTVAADVRNGRSRMSDMKVELKESLARRQAADKLSARDEGAGRPGRSCCRSG
jgi:hypothetical protein